MSADVCEAIQNKMAAIKQDVLTTLEQGHNKNSWNMASKHIKMQDLAKRHATQTLILQFKCHFFVVWLFLQFQEHKVKVESFSAHI